MTMKLVSGNTMLNIISEYAPQVGCSQQEKDQFYENLESEMRRIPLHEELVIGGDLNGHVGKDRSNFEREHGGHRYGQQNPEGESILSFAQAYNLVVAHTVSKERRAPSNIQKWGPVFSSRLHHHQKKETKEYQGP